MATMYDLFIQVFAYAIVFFGSIFVLNFLTKGFIITYLRVKASRGKNVLVRVYTKIGKYYAVGKVADDVLSYKKQNSKEKGHVDLTEADVFDELSVKVIEIEEITGKVIGKDSKETKFKKQIPVLKNFNAVDGHNTDKFDGILTRAMQRPMLADKTKETLMLLLQIITTIGVAFALYLCFSILQIIQSGGAKAGTGGVI